MSNAQKMLDQQSKINDMSSTVSIGCDDDNTAILVKIDQKEARNHGRVLIVALTAALYTIVKDLEIEKEELEQLTITALSRLSKNAAANDPIVVH